MDFVKMHACGNDYIYLDCIAHPLSDEQYRFVLSHIPDMCHRHFGIGGDGVVFVSAKDGAYRMDMYNADGTQGAICGNALRCVAHLLRTKHDATFPLQVKTKAGAVTVSYIEGLYRIAMPRARTLCDKRLRIGDRNFQYKIVDIGNTHAVLRHCTLPISEAHAAICKQEGDLNVESYFVKDGALHVSVCERGSGVTMACGSGACATAYAARLWGEVQDDHIPVVMTGGRVEVSFAQEDIFLMGDATYVYTGQYPLL